MINLHLGPLWHALRALEADIGIVKIGAESRPKEPVSDAESLMVRGDLSLLRMDCIRPLGLDYAWKTLNSLDDFFDARRAYPPKDYGTLVRLLEQLFEEIERELSEEFFFRYPREMARLMFAIEPQWAKVFDAFRSVRREVETGIDCYALGDYAGCIFHMMRVAEAGLRAIARERGVKSVGRDKPIEWGTWQDVFQAIEGQLKAVRQARPGPKKDLALAFYDTALSDLRRLQGYRDPTMHFRASYDKGEAFDAMHRVKGLMETLASKLSETNTRQIRWGL